MQFIDTTVFNPAYNNKLPILSTPTVDAICQELFYAIKSNEPIFVYGDYDMDGFCAAKVWDETLSTLYNVPVIHFMYVNRQHTLDPDIVRQAKESRARIVIICDTGSGATDHSIVSHLRLNGHTPIIIDHHDWVGDYRQAAKHDLVFNSYEERDILGGALISGAYASLLVCARLCEKYFHHSLSFGAMVYALASMYSDVVDVSTAPGRALYNMVTVMTGKLPDPALLTALNEFKYSYCKRFFSFMLGPKFNYCFRSEQYEPINRALNVTNKFEATTVATKLKESYTEAQKNTSLFVPLFTRERYGNIFLCIHEATDDTRAMHIRNYSGLIANTIAQEEKGVAIVVIHDNGEYVGSFRDFYNRKLLDTFRLFSDADGHESAFGIHFTSLADTRRHLISLSSMLSSAMRKNYDTLSSALIENKQDVQALAMYNEYMNVRPSIMLTHKVRRVSLNFSSSYRKSYDLGLPYPVSARIPIIEGSTILLEPRITSKVELRQVE